ncbi:hypothetical protein BGW38_007809 [Lunasporangiospora selenospora]|uniref:Uncharacterized protein n=1 Tax=Lunasporangiospora selenospora TaxID=979761 RepID=A0A9P6G0G3_9FUNG|nr:hypothetical protein BGW38_007809 [Lunasporangiospora selenospora]
MWINIQRDVLAKTFRSLSCEPWSLLSRVSQLGFDRPLAMLHREVNKKEGTIPPRLHFSTMDNDTFSILNTTLYKETTTDLNPSVEYFEDGWNFTIVDTKVSGLIDRFEESIHFSLKIQPAFDSTYPWVTVQLAHPGSNMTYFSDKDYGNQYQFLPGHIVQIRYKPIRYNMIAPPEEENIVYNSLQRIRNFFGFGVQVEDLTYETTIEHMPPTQNFSLSPFETLLIIRPKSDIESTQFLQEAPIIQDTLSKIGGLVSLVGSILVFLFGMNLVSPWGIVASIPWFRQRIARSLAKAYGNESGHSDGPFIVGNDQIGLLDEKMQAMTQGQQILLLKERLDELEAVLRDFYLDGSIFEDYARTAKSKDQ